MNFNHEVETFANDVMSLKSTLFWLFSSSKCLKEVERKAQMKNAVDLI